MARDATVRTVLTANDQASGPLRNFQNSLRGVKGEMTDANDVAGMLKGGIAGIAAAAGVDALMGLAQGVAELGRAGEQAGILRDAFDTTAAGVGASSASMLASIRTASGGMIADTDLMLAANRAMMLGVADSSAEMGELLEVAAVRGRAMGLTTSQAFNDLVTGLGRMSPMILDNLGIVTGGEAVFTAYAASIGKTAEALTDAERKQALFNKVVASTDTSGELVVSQFERMDAAISNAKTAMGELFGPAVAQIAQRLADAATQVADAMQTDATEAARNNIWGFGDEVTKLAAKLQDLNSLQVLGGDHVEMERLNAQITETNGLLMQYAQNYNQAAAMTGAPLLDLDLLQQGTVAFLSAADAAALLAEQQAETANAGKYLAEAERLVAESAGLMQGAIGRAGAAVDTIRGKFVQAAAAGMAASTAFANFSQFKGLEDQAEQIRAGLGNLGFYDQEEIAFYVDLNTERALTSADDMIKAFDDLGAAASGAASGGVSDLEKGLDDLQGKVQGALSEAISLDVTWPGKDGGDNRDINENARRMAAIANEGLIGQDWLGDLAAEAPGAYADLMLKIAEGMDPRGAAQSIMQDFQAGLRPDLLNLDALKEDIKNQIAGEAAMAATAAKITADLVADTGGDSADIQAKVNKALGLGVKSTELTDGIVGQLNSATFNASLNTAAAAGGKGWGQSFLSTVEANVPPALVALLVNLTTPGVLANIQAQAGLTGPVEP